MTIPSNSLGPLEQVRDPGIEDVAALLYDPVLPYHNFNHARDTLHYAADLVARSQRAGIACDARTIYLAMLFHDAGYHDDHLAKGCASKEHYAAQLAAEELARRGLDAMLIEGVKQAILGTALYGSFDTVEQQIVRAADLAGIAADYSLFHDNSIKLRREHELLSGNTITWSQWIGMVVTHLEVYLTQEIHLTSEFYNQVGRSVFHERARANIQRLRTEQQ